jgi:hypothetical protein
MITRGKKEHSVLIEEGQSPRSCNSDKHTFTTSDFQIREEILTEMQQKQFNNNADLNIRLLILDTTWGHKDQAQARWEHPSHLLKDRLLPAPEPPQGGLQKGARLLLALGYRLHDNVAKEEFKTR